MSQISVVIATKNRSEALETISLPSLARQDFKDFEVIIWDASDDDKSKIVVEKFIQSHSDMTVRYFKAPRVGLASQRNDAVKVANGDIIFFIDDDSEISENGLKSLFNAFKSNPTYVGVALPIKYSILLSSHKIIKKLFILYRKIFMLGASNSNRTKIYLSGLPEDAFNIPGETDHFKGCDMAFKINVFLNNKFEERLQRFGGYALFEDLQFTQKLHRKGEKLFITDSGYVIHHGVNGMRFQSKNSSVGAIIYNHFVVWQTCVYPDNKFSMIFFLWSLLGRIIFLFLLYLGNPLRNFYILRGIKIGIGAIVSDIINQGKDVLTSEKKV